MLRREQRPALMRYIELYDAIYRIVKGRPEHILIEEVWDKTICWDCNHRR